MEKRYIKSCNVVFKNSSDDLTVFNHKTGDYYSLNPAGATILTFCEKSRSLEEIIDNFKSSYDNCPQDIQKITETYLCKLVERNLLTIDD